MSPKRNGTGARQSAPTSEALLEYIREETMSEELQTMSDELRLRTEEVDRANAFLEPIVRSLHVGVAVLDRELRVVEWNAKAGDLWGVRAEEVAGTSFADLDIGLPVFQTDGGAARPGPPSPYREEVVAGRDRRGRAIRCRVTGTPLAYLGGSAWGRC